MSNVATKPITIAEFEKLPLERAELVRGEVVEMPPPGVVHGKVCTNVAYLLESWSRSLEDFETFSNDGGVVTERDPDTVRGPDVAVLRRSKLPGDSLPVGSLGVAPELTVEVKSPSNSWPELVRKAAEYLSCGVCEVWIIDTDKRHLHVYTQDDEPTSLDTDATLNSTALPEFSTPVAEFFRGL